MNWPLPAEAGEVVAVGVEHLDAVFFVCDQDLLSIAVYLAIALPLAT